MKTTITKKRIKYFPYQVSLIYDFRTEVEALKFEEFAKEYFKGYEERIKRMGLIALYNMTAEDILQSLPEELKEEYEERLNDEVEE